MTNRQRSTHSHTTSKPVPAQAPSFNHEERAALFLEELLLKAPHLKTAEGRAVLCSLVTPEFEPEGAVSLQDIDALRTAPLQGVPFESLRRLVSLIKERSMQDLSSPEEVVKIDYTMRVLLAGRELTQAPLGRAAELIWKHVFPLLEEGFLLIPTTLKRRVAFLSKCDTVTMSGVEFSKIPLDENFNTLVGAKNIFQSIAAFEEITSRSFIALTKLLQVTDSDISQCIAAADEPLSLRLSSPQGMQHSGLRAMEAGFSSGVSLVCKSLLALLEAVKRDGLWGQLNADSIERMVVNHAQFVFPLSTISFSAFVGFTESTMTDPRKGVADFINQLRLYEPSQAQCPVRKPPRSSLRSDPKFFRALELPDKQGVPTISLDLNLAAFSPEVLAAILCRSKAFGCPAKLVINEMVPWALNSLHAIGTSRLENIKQ